MRAIIKDKLYDTEKATFVNRVNLGLSATSVKQMDVYRTNKGNVFAVDINANNFITSEELKEILKFPGFAYIYIEIFGTPEEA